MDTRWIVLTFVVLLGTVVLFEYSGIDMLVQDHFYNFESGQWLVNRYDKTLKFIFYTGIKRLYILFILLVAVALVFFRKTRVVQDYKQGLLVVLLSTLLVPMVVGVLKATTNTPCPRHLVHYGHEYPYVTVLEKYPEDFRQTEKIECYPAGHASGGFALLSLVFLFRKKRNKAVALAFAMITGWSIGTYKILIGDHFLSHTLVAMLLAWLIILLVEKAVRSLYAGREPGSPDL